MSIDAISWAFKQNVKPAAKKFVLVALADNADQYGICFPSYNHIAEKTGLSRRSVIENCKALVKDGIIQKSGRNRANQSTTSNAYLLPFTDDCIDDHPLSVLFKWEGAADALPPVQELHPPVQELHPPSAGAAPLEPSYNHHITKDKKIPLTRFSFCREISVAFKTETIGDEFDHLKEIEIVNAAGACCDWLEINLKYPDEGKAVCQLRTWLRKGMRTGAIRKAPKAAKGCKEDNSMPDLPKWQQEALSEGIFEIGEFRSWIAPLVWNGNGKLYAPTNFHAKTVDERYRAQIERALHSDITITVKPKEGIQ